MDVELLFFLHRASVRSDNVRKIKPRKLKTIDLQIEEKSKDMDSRTEATASVPDMEEWFRRELAGNGDIVFRELSIGSSGGMNAVLVYMYGSIDKNTLNTNVIRPLMTFRDNTGNNSDEHITIKSMMESCISVGTIKAVKDRNLAKEEIFEGRVVILIDSLEQIIVLEVAGTKSRQVSEPENEKALRGSKEGFIEDIWNNIALIRRTLPDPALKVEVSKVGRRTKTNLAVIYIDNLADEKLVREVKKRIKKIDVDGVLANGYIEAFIEDSPFSPFPQTQGTEKPDKVAAALLEGRIAVALDRTALVLMVPAQLVQFFQAPEDYNDRFLIGTYIRILRGIAFLVTTSAAPAYIALNSFHPELIPIELLLNIAEMRKQVPFPPFVEALVMEFVIESLREAGLRLPAAVATTLGVVGGIILGDAAVRSNLASPPMIIVVTITIICNFIIPNYSMSLVIRLIRLFLILLAAAFGAFGITLGWLAIIIHLCRLESFGVPYFAPLGPVRFKDLKDLYIRVPIWAMKERPESIPVKDRKRMGNFREQKNGK